MRDGKCGIMRFFDMNLVTPSGFGPSGLTALSQLKIGTVVAEAGFTP